MMLEVRALDVRYGDVPALLDVSLQVDQGTIVALLGANGAGKTTLLRTISGLKLAHKGQIVFSGKELSGLLPEKVVDLGISHVPEGRRLFLKLTVMENLELGAFPPRARSALRDSILRAFDLFPILKARKNQIAGSLSGGEQQMLAIARALMARPTLLLLDEPSLGLSPIVVKTIFQLIRTLNEQMMTILLIEQNVYQALKIAHSAFVIKTGQITLSGSGKEMLANTAIQKAYMGTLE